MFVKKKRRQLSKKLKIIFISDGSKFIKVQRIKHYIIKNNASTSLTCTCISHIKYSYHDDINFLPDLPCIF